MRYRRAGVPGGTYFFTVNLRERNKTLLTDHIDQLKDSIRTVKQAHPFRINALVILPDHFHTIWSLPENDADFATRLRLIKTGFSKRIPNTESMNASRRYKRERGIWQRRFWEHVIRDESDYNRHVDYIHFNPVKHGHVDKPVDWPYSSIHKFICDGLISKDWGNRNSIPTVNFGEWK